MRYLTIILLFVYGCSRQAFEMEQLADDVIKSRHGVEIEIKPDPKD